MRSLSIADAQIYEIKIIALTDEVSTRTVLMHKSYYNPSFLKMYSIPPESEVDNAKMFCKQIINPRKINTFGKGQLKYEPNKKY